MSLPGFAAEASFAPRDPARRIVPAVAVPRACQALIEECLHAGSGSPACRAAVECMVSTPSVTEPRTLLR
jgi:hypothetical protein